MSVCFRPRLCEKSEKNWAGGVSALNMNGFAQYCDNNIHLKGIIAQYRLAFTTFTKGNQFSHSLGHERTVITNKKAPPEDKAVSKGVETVAYK